MTRCRRIVALGMCSALLSLSLTGCAERYAQRAVQASLTSLAHGLDATDELVNERWPAAAEAARAQVLRERESDPDMTVEAGMARYEALMAPWNRTLTAMRAVRSALRVGQAAVTVWIRSGELPGEWRGFCQGIEDALTSLPGLLEGLEVSVPSQLDGAAGYASEACSLAAPWIAGMVEGGEEGG